MFPADFSERARTSDGHGLDFVEQGTDALFHSGSPASATCGRPMRRCSSCALFAERIARNGSTTAGIGTSAARSGTRPIPRRIAQSSACFRQAKGRRFGALAREAPFFCFCPAGRPPARTGPLRALNERWPQAVNRDRRPLSKPQAGLTDPGAVTVRIDPTLDISGGRRAGPTT